MSVVGLGTVGGWLLRALRANAERLSREYGLAPTIVGAGSARDGFIFAPQGLDVATLLELRSARRGLADHPGAHHWPTCLEGLEATDADVLVEVSASPPEDGEPGVGHMRMALRRGIAVVTSNKWPVALHGLELAALARGARVPFRAESTVMSGTPVLSSLTEGLAGTTPVRLRGVLNATANFVLTEIEKGRSYEESLAEAQAVGLAERDPSADVDGYDSMSKTMILAALVFGVQLGPEDVLRTGIAGIDLGAVESARSEDARIRLVSTLGYTDDRQALRARVEPLVLQANDPLARLDGVTNAVVVETDPVGEVMIAGPGAGVALAGQGVLSDLVAVCRQRALA